MAAVLPGGGAADFFVDMREKRLRKCRKNVEENKRLQDAESERWKKT